MARLQIEGLCKGWDFPVIDRLDLSVEEGEFFAIVGPSGIGKSTLLRLVAGLEVPDAGTIRVGGEDQTALPPYKRRTAMTFESYALYPHMTVFSNIASPLRARRVAREDVDRRVREVAQLLHIEALLDRKPGEISGGQKQRTALGRTLIADPEVFLLDEPISHLDAKIRSELREQFRSLEALRQVATLYVTHDYAEALSLGDRVGVMGNGGLMQVGAGRELFERPNHLFVARQLGQPSINILETDLLREDGKLHLRARDGELTLTLASEHENRLNGVKGTVTLGIRPQHVRVLEDGEEAGPDHQVLQARVGLFEALGTEGIVMAEISGTRLTALTSPENTFKPGDAVRLAVSTGAFHFFDSGNGNRIEQR